MTLQGTLGRLRRQVIELVFEPVTDRRRWKHPLVYLMRLGMHVGSSLRADQCLQRASSLAYTTILSLVPVTALFVLYFKMAGKLDTFSDKIQEWILDNFVAEAAQGVSVYIDQFVANLHTRTIGTVGAAGLMFTTYSLFKTVEKSFDAIWKVPTHRSFVARFQILCTLLIVVPTFFAASLYLSSRFQEFKLFHQYADIPGTMKTLFVGAPFLLTAIPLLLSYKFLPNVTVKWKPAMIGALTSAILFETAKWGFNLYVMKVIPVSKIYGSLGLFPVFLLWIYFSWIIILFGVELSFTIQNLSLLHREATERRHMAFSTPIHEDWGLQVIRALVKRFAKGDGPVNIDMLSKDLSLTTSVLNDHLELLRQSNILAWVEDEERSGYVPVQPVEILTVGEIVAVFRNHLGLPERQESGYKKSLLEFAKAS
ncbi:MAG TPA: YhjD/YihY/BrkB family envelope integrity protein [Bdellovibrionota bacterium]|nr:YhjD/YihY/BrkB family envelope integrity protein [Bdellovibrionota bacterium]